MPGILRPPCAGCLKMVGHTPGCAVVAHAKAYANRKQKGDMDHTKYLEIGDLPEQDRKAVAELAGYIPHVEARNDDNTLYFSDTRHRAVDALETIVVGLLNGKECVEQRNKAAGKQALAEYVLTGTGEGASCKIVTDLREGLHTFMCLCGKAAEHCGEKENTEVSHLLKEMEGDDNWSFDEAGRRFQYQYDGYCYGITVTVLQK